MEGVCGLYREISCNKVCSSRFVLFVHKSRKRSNLYFKLGVATVALAVAQLLFCLLLIFSLFVYFLNTISFIPFIIPFLFPQILVSETNKNKEKKIYIYIYTKCICRFCELKFRKIWE